MSLKEFVNRPAIKDAFKNFGMRERTPASLRHRPLLVPDIGGPRGLAGTAFDYLARFHIARELCGSNVKLHQETSILDRAIARLEWSGAPAVDNWKTFFAEARAEEAAYTRGGGNVRRLADLVQYFAMIDVFYRSGYFNPEFRPVSKVSEEVLRLLDLFDPVARLSPHHLCLLNPEFVASARVNGADADLVIDDRLIDLKATAELSVSLENLLQLAGYAALQQMGGIALGDSAYQSTFVSVELYFARYGELVRWPLEEFFPDDRFRRFCDVFRMEIEANERSVEEDTRQLEGQASPMDATLFGLIAQTLRELPEPKKLPKIKHGKHRASQDMPHLRVDKKGAEVLKTNKNYAARCRALAKKFGCIFIADPNGDFIFLKLPEESAARGKARSTARKARS